MQPAIAAARAAGVPVIGELELASRWLRGRDRRDHRHQGEVDDDDADRPDARGGRASRCWSAATSASPLSAQVDESTPDTIHVVEASSFQLETTDTFHPWIAVLLNFSPDHLDRHADVAEYAAAKARIFANQTPATGRWSTPTIRPSLALARTDARRARLLFARRAAIADGIVVDGDCDRRGARPAASSALVPLSAVKLLGRHLLRDVLAAAAVGVARRRRRRTAMTRAVEGFTRPRARAGAGRRDRRRAVRQRLEGHQHRGGAARRSRASTPGWSRSSAAGSRAATSAICASRCGARAAAVVAIGEARAAGARGAGRRRCRCTTRPTWSRRCGRAFAVGVAGRRGAAGAGVLELRHVPRLRGARPACSSEEVRRLAEEWSERERCSA